MSVEMTVVPSAFGALQQGLGEAAGLATTAGDGIVSVDPSAFTKAMAGAAASGLTPALRGAQAICAALGTTTQRVSDKVGQTADLYRKVEEEGVALARTIETSLDGALV